jgi:hypothetical protein
MEVLEEILVEPMVAVAAVAAAEIMVVAVVVPDKITRMVAAAVPLGDLVIKVV